MEVVIKVGAGLTRNFLGKSSQNSHVLVLIFLDLVYHVYFIFKCHGSDRFPNKCG